MSVVDNKTVLLTGGTGSFGKQFTELLLRETAVRKVIIFSRDELKQWEMQRGYADESRLRFFIGDVRDLPRLERAFDGVDVVVHAAALKQVPATEYNPFEAVKTNIHGAKNIIDAAIDRGIEKVIALSTDKACSPINLYGATKLVSDKLFVDGNAYAGAKHTRFAVVRYGNVVGSRGSVVPLFKQMAAGGGSLPITDERMTRFWITLDQAARFVLDCFATMRGGEIFVPKIPSMHIVDLARALAPDSELEEVGIRPGEKLHEALINPDDARRTVDLGTHYVIEPDMDWWSGHPVGGQPVADDFSYTSDNNQDFLSIEQIRAIADDV